MVRATNVSHNHVPRLIYITAFTSKAAKVATFKNQMMLCRLTEIVAAIYGTRLFRHNTTDVKTPLTQQFSSIYGGTD